MHFCETFLITFVNSYTFSKCFLSLIKIGMAGLEIFVASDNSLSVSSLHPISIDILSGASFFIFMVNNFSTVMSI